jgi:hypothetical protein
VSFVGVIPCPLPVGYFGFVYSDISRPFYLKQSTKNYEIVQEEKLENLLQ